MKRAFGLLSLFVLLSSCGKYDRLDDGGFSTVQFKPDQANRFSLTATVLTYGVLIYAYSSTYATNLKLADSNQTSQIVLPNGSYTFYAFGYANNLSDGSGSDIRCALGSANLTGSATAVTLDFKQSNCQNSAFTAGGAYLDPITSTLPNSGPVFSRLDVVYCGSAGTTPLASLSTAGTQDCTTMGGTGISAPWTSVAGFNIIFPIFYKSGSNYVRMSEAYRSPCSHSLPSSSGGTAVSQFVRFPGGNGMPLPFEIEAFSETACTSTPLVKHTFRNGLAAGPNPDATYLSRVIPIAGSNKVRLYLRQP